MLDAARLTSTRIIISGDLDEWKIQDMERARAPVDTYAVGTALTTSDDAPALGGVYKLVEIESGGITRPVMKRSAGKGTWPGRKQVWRRVEPGIAAHDVIGLSTESPPPSSMPLLELVMRDGQRTSPPVPLEDLRRNRAEMVAMLPAAFRELSTPVGYDVVQSTTLSVSIT
jgi:nicotinate phosphoribosyltransferase